MPIFFVSALTVATLSGILLGVVVERLGERREREYRLGRRLYSLQRDWAAAEDDYVLAPSPASRAA